MTSRERMARAMRPTGSLRLPDRVPVMCQLALGHYFLNAGLDPVDIWYDSGVFATALLRLQRRYRFDGILVNLPGRDPGWRSEIAHVESRVDGRRIAWRSGLVTIVPPDDNPIPMTPANRPPCVVFADLDPDRLFYVEPHGMPALACLASAGDVPPWQWRTLELVRQAAPDISVHGEVFSPFSQMLELLGCEAGLLAMMLDAAKFTACLQRLTAGAVALGCGQFEAGADAVVISSAFAGAGFLSRTHYTRFVLPFERDLVAGLKASDPGRRVYTHTCGAIGDRLDLLEATGTDGIDTLDPPPLGTTDLEDALAALGDRLFIKGNVNPVDTVLSGNPDGCYKDVCERIAAARAAGRGGGYILSTACSVPPHAPPENILALTRAAEDTGAL